MRFLLILLTIAVLGCGEDSPMETFKVTLMTSNTTPTIDEQVILYLRVEPQGILATNFRYEIDEKIITTDTAVVVFDREKKVIAKVSAAVNNQPFTEEIEINVAGQSLRKALQNFDKSKIKVCSHRAYTAPEVPENSLAAIEKAIEVGVFLAEIDVRKTKDNVLVLMHDNTIDRTTYATGKVSDWNWGDLQKVKLKSSSGEHYIPTLEQVLQKARGRLFLNIDYINKGITEAQIYSMVKQAGMLEQVLFYTSEDIEKSRIMSGMSAQNLVFPLCSRPDYIDIFAAIQPKIFIMQLRNNSSLSVSFVNQTNQHFISFTNILDNLGDSDMLEENYQKVTEVINKNINVIQTDQPEKLIRYLQSLNLY